MYRLFSRPHDALVVGVFALAGGVWGTSTALQPAHACECPWPTWEYRLESVNGLQDSRDHAPYWPEAVSLSAYEGTAALWAAEGGPETLDYITADARLEEDR